MNWDTHEISMLIESDERFYNILRRYIENELEFMIALKVIIDYYNEQMKHTAIDSSNVNGNEVYVSFCESCGYETEGWE